MTLQVKRLEKVANHLIHNMLGQDKWDFSEIHKISSCGTAGCAMGELPVIFPKLWKYDLKDSDDPVKLRKDSSNDSFYDVERFFGLSKEERRHLFMPAMWEPTQKPELYGGKRLSRKCKPQTVGKQIHAFLKKKKEFND